MKEAPASPLSLELVAVFIGCLLMAMLCVGALARLAPGPVTTAAGSPTEQEIQSQRDGRAIYEIDGGGTLVPFHPAFAR
jgi:hypothetical protein